MVRCSTPSRSFRRATFSYGGCAKCTACGGRCHVRTIDPHRRDSRTCTPTRHSSKSSWYDRLYFSRAGWWRRASPIPCRVLATKFPAGCRGGTSLLAEDAADATPEPQTERPRWQLRDEDVLCVARAWGPRRCQGDAAPTVAGSVPVATPPPGNHDVLAHPDRPGPYFLLEEGVCRSVSCGQPHCAQN